MYYKNLIGETNSNEGPPFIAAKWGQYRQQAASD